jgi:hypothetical protein
VTGFLIRFFSGSGSVPVFGVDRFNDRFGSCNIEMDNGIILQLHEMLITKCHLWMKSLRRGDPGALNVPSIDLISSLTTLLFSLLVGRR